RAIETRQSRHSFERLNTPLAEKVLLARAFSVTAEERDVRLSENRRELAEHWGNPPPMEPDTFSWSTYTPYGFIHRNHIQWFPAEKQRREARNALPYVARNHFIHQRGDGVRHDCFFTFIRRPGYYVAFNSGEHYRSQQRLGLGLLWHPEFGTLLQSQTGTRDFAWGTRLVGGDSVAEAASINAVFIIDGKPIPPEPGARDLPDGELTVRYPVPGGEKQLRFLDD